MPNTPKRYHNHRHRHQALTHVGEMLGSTKPFIASKHCWAASDVEYSQKATITTTSRPCCSDQNVPFGLPFVARSLDLSTMGQRHSNQTRQAVRQHYFTSITDTHTHTHSMRQYILSITHYATPYKTTICVCYIFKEIPPLPYSSRHLE